jgi:hypothetical protein
LKGGSNLATGTVSSSNGMNRSDPSMFASSGSLAFSAGDVLALKLAPSAGQVLTLRRGTPRDCGHHETLVVGSGC